MERPEKWSASAENALATVPPTAPRNGLERGKDPLVYLPCCPNILDYPKGQTVYAPQEPAASIYLILRGAVKITRSAGDGRQVVIDMYQPEEFFGEAALLHVPVREDWATAVDETKLMAWSAREFTEVVAARPPLALALLPVMVQRLMAFSQRVESLAQDSVLERLGRSLIRFARRMGRPEQDSVRLPPLAHSLLAQYVGTSREIVTHYMTEFRARGFLTYTRQEILLHGAALERWLESDLARQTVGDSAGAGEGNEAVRETLAVGSRSAQRLRFRVTHSLPGNDGGIQAGF